MSDFPMRWRSVCFSSLCSRSFSDWVFEWWLFYSSLFYTLTMSFSRSRLARRKITRPSFSVITTASHAIWMCRAALKICSFCPKQPLLLCIFREAPISGITPTNDVNNEEWLWDYKPLVYWQLSPLVSSTFYSFNFMHLFRKVFITN